MYRENKSTEKKRVKHIRSHSTYVFTSSVDRKVSNINKIPLYHPNIAKMFACVRFLILSESIPFFFLFLYLGQSAGC